MKRLQYFFWICLCSCITSHAQSRIPFNSYKPYNNENIIIRLGYERQPDDTPGNDLAKYCLSIGYGFTDWCEAGLYGCFGTKRSMILENNQLYAFRKHFFMYGLHNEIHPISFFMPGFYFIDAYTIVRVGLSHQIIKYEEDDLPPDYYYFNHNTCTPYLAGGFGIAVNPSRHFGLFYERTYTSLNTNNNKWRHEFNRFGINIRFGGPKKTEKKPANISIEK